MLSAWFDAKYYEVLRDVDGDFLGLRAITYSHHQTSISEDNNLVALYDRRGKLLAVVECIYNKSFLNFILSYLKLKSQTKK